MSHPFPSGTADPHLLERPGLSQARMARPRGADEAFAAGSYAEALTLYESRAAGGDAFAGEMAGYMLYFGPVLFGAGVPCDRPRARRWLAIAAGDGRRVAQMMVRRIDRGAADQQPALYASLPCPSASLQ